MTDIRSLIARSLDNTAPLSHYNDLGLFHFARTWFGDAFGLPFGQVHYKIVNGIFNLYHPSNTDRLERQYYTMVHRGAAKTTLASYLFPLYNIFLKGMTTHVRVYRDGWEGGTGVDKSDVFSYELGEDFILIISETASSAENFVSNIKTQIDQRTDLIPIFGDKHASALEIDIDMARRGDQMWRKNAFITSDRTIIYGIGSGQQVRGRNVLNRRPTMVVIDDMYSEKNTKTIEARQKLDNWFYSAMKNSVDIRKGKVIVLGTMVHPDTVFKDFSTSDLWKGTSVPVISQEGLMFALGHCKKEGMYLRIPSKEECKQLEPQVPSLSWKENYSLHSVLSLYKESYEKGKENGFYQEYMNIIKRDAERSIDRRVFCDVPMKIVPRKGQWIIEVEYEGRVWESVCQLYGGIDIASSTRDSSDDTVFVLCGIGEFTAAMPGTTMLERRTFPYIYSIIGGKLGIFSVSEADSKDGRARAGWVNIAEGLSRKLPVEQIVVEIAGQTETIFNEAYAYFTRQRVPTSLFPQKPGNTLKKEERIMSILLPITQKYKTVLVNNTTERRDMFYSQLEHLGSDGMHDDYPDATAYAFLYARAPLQEVIDKVVPVISRTKEKQYRVNSWESM